MFKTKLPPFVKTPIRFASETSLEFAKFFKLGNTGHFFKKVTFVGLAFNNLTDKRYRTVTLRSVIMSL